VSKPQIDWNNLRGKYDEALIATTQRLFSDPGPFSISAEQLASDSNAPEQQAEELLEKLCPPLQVESVYNCPNCDLPLGEEEALLESCPRCHQQFVEYGGLRVSRIFAHIVPPSRDVAWVLALHGMNTQGAWQEEFNWRVSTAYLRSVPVAIYKYGLVRPGALWKPFLKRLTRDLVIKIGRLKGTTEESGFMGPPDVIAHSLGTWLLGHALRWNPSLRVGRVILTGCILRPDFDWAALKARGQVEGVLNHYGTKDFWAGIAHYAMPDSGPSGRVGFNRSEPIVQTCEQGFGHSDFFSERHLPRVFDTVWRPFLAVPAKDLQISDAETRTQWRQAPWILRGTIVPLILLLMYWIVAALVVYFFVLGAYEAVLRLIT
jgi:hypothetical protein